jgi:hypothetical protein
VASQFIALDGNSFHTKKTKKKQVGTNKPTHVAFIASLGLYCACITSTCNYTELDRAADNNSSLILVFEILSLDFHLSEIIQRQRDVNESEGVCGLRRG